jgi:hypothetical protein
VASGQCPHNGVLLLLVTDKDVQKTLAELKAVGLPITNPDKIISNQPIKPTMVEDKVDCDADGRSGDESSTKPIIIQSRIVLESLLDEEVERIHEVDVEEMVEVEVDDINEQDKTKAKGVQQSDAITFPLMEDLLKKVMQPVMDQLQQLKGTCSHCQINLTAVGCRSYRSR